MKPEDLTNIASEAAYKINPSMKQAMAQLGHSHNAEIRIGVEAMRRTKAHYESVIADAIREALLVQSGEAFLELSNARKRIADLEEALGMLTTWAKTDSNEPDGDIVHLIEVVIEHARKVLFLDDNFEPITTDEGQKPNC